MQKTPTSTNILSPHTGEATLTHASGLTRHEALRVFDLLYDAAWTGMGGTHVLGTNREAVRKAYGGSLIGSHAPHFWLELPLAGTPHSDLHVSYDFAEMVPDATFAPQDGLGYQRLFDWFCRAGRPHTGIDLTFDLGESEVEAVGAYVSFHDSRKVDLTWFCTALDCPDDAWRCRKAVDVFPDGWNVWYTSPFPGRDGNPVRAAALATKELQRHFASDSSLVRNHLARIGISSIPDSLCVLVSELAKLPITLEWRITIDACGEVRDHCDVSFYLSRTYLSGSDVRKCFGERGAGTQALRLFEQWGIADDRWHDVIAGSFAKKGPFRLDDGRRCALVGICSPSCFMSPWEKGHPLTAKVYPRLEAFLVRQPSADRH